MSKRRCKGETDEGDCRANPLKDSDFCLAHSDGNTRDLMRFGGAQPGAGRPKNPRAVDILRERLEGDADRILDALWNALDADTATVVLAGEEREVELVPDHRTRIAAAREILDRAYGKPKQATEVSGPDGGPVAVVDMSDEQTRALVGDLLRRRPASSGE
jgi:hypothetical protein